MADEYGPEYRRGHVSMDRESLEHVMLMDPTDCVFGIQIADDGRVWVCVNSVTFLRFKPNGKDIGTFKGQDRYGRPLEQAAQDEAEARETWDRHWNNTDELPSYEEAIKAGPEVEPERCGSCFHLVPGHYSHCRWFGWNSDAQD